MQTIPCARAVTLCGKILQMSCVYHYFIALSSCLVSFAMVVVCLCSVCFVRTSHSHAALLANKDSYHIRDICELSRGSDAVFRSCRIKIAYRDRCYSVQRTLPACFFCGDQLHIWIYRKNEQNSLLKLLPRVLSIAA